GEVESPSSKARKQLHGNKPDFMLRAKIGDKELELVNMETGRPESDLKKQLSDHNKLARSAKDAFEDFSINGSVKKYGYDELTKIFCLNVKGK
ncbi:34398_t:CDS:1, partial [Gigaspora margarita]